VVFLREVILRRSCKTGALNLIGLSAVILTDMSSETLRYREDLLREAAMVHDAARLVHGLD